MSVTKEIVRILFSIELTFTRHSNAVEAKTNEPLDKLNPPNCQSQCVRNEAKDMRALEQIAYISLYLSLSPIYICSLSLFFFHLMLNNKILVNVWMCDIFSSLFPTNAIALWSADSYFFKLKSAATTCPYTFYADSFVGNEGGSIIVRVFGGECDAVSGNRKSEVCKTGYKSNEIFSLQWETDFSLAFSLFKRVKQILSVS